MDIMTALLPKNIVTPAPADDRRLLPTSDTTLKNTCTALLSPLYAPVAKPISANNAVHHLESANPVWERTAKPFDLGDYFTYAKKILVESGTTAGNNAVHPYVNNSLYYDHLINGGGSFNNHGVSSAVEHENDGCSGKGNEGQQHTLYSIAFSKPLVIPSAWSSLEDLTTPTTATSSSAATSRCSTPATNGWTFVERPQQVDPSANKTQDSADPIVAQQRDALKTRSFSNLQALKKRTSTNGFTSNSGELPQSSPSDGHNMITHQQQPKVRRSSNTTIISDTTSENSDKSTTIELEKEQKKATLYKTEMCRNWEERGSCRYGNKCQFAHSENELRKITHHPKYKTEICKTFWQNGTCPYGKRCCFIHNDKNGVLRRNSSENLKNSSKNSGSKSKGLSKFCSDPALYGSYVNDSTPPAPSSTVANAPETRSTSNSDSLRAFTDAYFSGQANQGSSESVDGKSSSTISKDTSSAIASVHHTTPVNNISNCSIVYDQENYIFEDDEDDETGLADKSLLLSEAINDFGSIPVPPDMYVTKFDKDLRPQTRRRASTTSCRLDKAAISSSSVSTTVVSNAVLRERSVSVSVNANVDPVPNNNLVPVVGHNRGRRLAIFRNLG